MLGSLLVTLLLAAPADAPEQPLPAVRHLRHGWAIDGSVTGAGLAAWISTETAFKKQLAPAACRWCDRRPDGTDTLNGLDAWARGLRASPGGQSTADTVSSALAFGILPAALIGFDVLSARAQGALWAIPVDLLIIAEAAVLAILVDQAVKFAAGRSRPFVHALPLDQAAARTDPDDNLSFFSGHSTFAFALTVATGTVARLRGYRWAWLVWAVGLPLATAVPLLRMNADKHYLTDVLVGSAVGAAFGFSVPTLLHGVEGVEGTVAPIPGGIALAGTF